MTEKEWLNLKRGDVIRTATGQVVFERYYGAVLGESAITVTPVGGGVPRCIFNTANISLVKPGELIVPDRTVSA